MTGVIKKMCAILIQRFREIRVSHLALGSMLICLLAWSAANAEGQTSIRKVEITFDELPRYIQEQNTGFRGARSLVRAAAARTGHLRRSYLPDLDLFGGVEVFRTGSYPIATQPFGAIETKINLYRGGRDSLEEKARAAQVTLASAEQEREYFNELTKARKAYWNIAFQQELLKILRDASQQNEKNLAAANRRIRSGISTATDLLEFEMYGIQLTQDIAKLSLDFANTNRVISALLGLPGGSETIIKGELSHDHENSSNSSTLDLENHREIKILSSSREISQIRGSQTLRWWAPSLDVYGGLLLYTLRDRDYLSQSSRYDAVGGVKLTFKLFDGLQSNTEGVSLSRKADALGDQALQVSRDLAAQFESAKQTLRFTHDLIHSAELNVQKGQQYLTNTLTEYGRGVKNSPDVFGATQKYVDSRRRVAELKRDYQLARAEILASIESPVLGSHE